MSDSYQAIYDAVRSRISNADVGGAVEQAMRNANLSHYAELACRSAQEAASEHMRPSVLFRPQLSADGSMWCALYGEDLQSGVAGFGETPALAMWAFDKAWLTERTPASHVAARISAEDAAREAEDNGQFGVGA